MCSLGSRSRDRKDYNRRLYRIAYPKDLVRLLKYNWTQLLHGHPLSGANADCPFKTEFYGSPHNALALRYFNWWTNASGAPLIQARLHESSAEAAKTYLWALEMSGCLSEAHIERDHRQDGRQDEAYTSYRLSRKSEAPDNHHRRRPHRYNILAHL